jgi:tetraacyldisaccharide 4'-kinase
LEASYKGAIAVRNRWHDYRGPKVRLPIPVVSIGNVTAGGTGKTPMVVEVVRRLEQMGRRPAVVARGYKASADGPNDEERLIRRHVPRTVYVADPDRARGAMRAHAEFGAEVVVLDDGFQHRRLHRDLDIVMVDATCPFGHDRLLPRGLLREPATNVGRADVIVISRADQASAEELGRLEERLRGLAPRATLLKCRHLVTSIECMDGTPLSGSPADLRAVLFAGIGRPEAFAATVETLGIQVVESLWWPDHHHYVAADLDRLRTSRRAPHDLLLTTEKDAVKLADLWTDLPENLYVVKIAIDFLGEDDKMFADVLRRTIHSS